jgi:hypothetical protein
MTTFILMTITLICILFWLNTILGLTLYLFGSVLHNVADSRNQAAKTPFVGPMPKDDARGGTLLCLAFACFFCYQVYFNLICRM